MSKQQHIVPRKVWSQKDNQRSFAQVVKSGSVSNSLEVAFDTTPHIRVKVETTSWLKKCFAGRLSEAAGL